MEGVEAKPAVKKKAGRRGEEQARMSYDLATIRCDAPSTFPPRTPGGGEADGPALYELFLTLEFNKLIDKMGLSGGPAAPDGRNGRGTCTSEVVEDAPTGFPWRSWWSSGGGAMWPCWPCPLWMWWR